MRLIDTITGAPAVAMLGMCKNAGKTTAMNALIRDYPERGVLCITSIGMDGEDRDQVTGTEKPSLWMREGMLAATAEGLLPCCDVSREILSASGIHTSLGEIIVFRAVSDGFVRLAGPAVVEHLGNLRKILARFGADCILIDGALNRKSPMAGAKDGVCILSTGASLDRDMEKVVEETAYAVKLLNLPSYKGKIVSGAASGRIRALCGDDREEFIDDPGKIPDLSGLKFVLFPGALTESYGRALLHSKAIQAGVTIVVKDSSCLLLKRETWNALVSKDICFAVQSPARLAAVTVNPWSPEGWRFDPVIFVEKMRTAVSVPVFDVLSGVE